MGTLRDAFVELAAAVGHESLREANASDVP
jgi:hypothetical protein